MTSPHRNALTDAVQRIVAAVQKDYEEEFPFGMWHATEGERVLENACALSSALEERQLQQLLGGGNVLEFLGLGWLECHSKAYGAAEAFQDSAHRAGVI